MPNFASTPAPVHTLWDTPDMPTQRLPGSGGLQPPHTAGLSCLMSARRQCQKLSASTASITRRM